MGDPNVSAVWLERLKEHNKEHISLYNNMSAYIITYKEHKIYKIRFLIPRGINMQNNTLYTNLYKNLDKVIDNS